jgi:hypothetical protein
MAMALDLNIKIGGSLWSAGALTPLSHFLIGQLPNEEWESGVKALAPQSFALIYAELNAIAY